MAERSFDVVVIGGGSAGEVCAERVAKGGLSAALAEEHLVGGECSYYACMPSKALLRPAEILAELQRVPGAREAMTGELDVGAALRRRDEVISNRDDAGQEKWLADRGIELVRGEARLDGERRVRVAEETLTARRAVVIATGSSAAMPPVPGLADARPLDNRDVTTMSAPPATLLVLGGGYVGVEMAQAWSSLGSTVTVLEAGERLIAREEPFASEQVADALRDRGVEVRTGVKVESVSRSDGRVTAALEGGETHSADELLVAAGRRPRTEGLGLEPFGVQPGRPVEVDDQMRAAGTDWLYAVGDVNARSPLTHMGKYQARIAGDHILGRQVRATQDGPGAPHVIFTDPQVAAVGHTLASAREAGLNARAVDHPTAWVAGASFHGRNAPGTSRLVVDEGRGVLVGATFTGPEIGESLHAATIAIVGEVPLERLWHSVPAFPTRSEVWLRLMESYGL